MENDPLRRQPSGGFSLVETLIALVVATGGIYAVLQLSSLGTKAQKGVENSAELITLDSTLQLLLLQKSPCDSILIGTHFNPSVSMEDPTGTRGPAFLQATSLALKWPTSGGTATTFLQAPTSANPSPDQPWYHYGGWNLNPNLTPPSATIPAGVGLRLIGPAGTNRYLISVEVNLTKKTLPDGTPVSLGSQSGKRQAVTLTVTATGSATDVAITGCSGPSTVAWDQKTGTTDISTSSTTWVPTDLVISNFPTDGSPVMVTVDFVGYATDASAGRTPGLQIAIQEDLLTGGTLVEGPGSANSAYSSGGVTIPWDYFKIPLTMSHVFTPSAGSHTYTLMWRAANGTAYNAPAAAPKWQYRKILARELK